MDPRLVRTLARHYYDLQGWHTAFSVPVCQAAAWAWSTTRSEWWTYAAIVATGLLAAWPAVLLQRYYRSFGRVVTATFSTPAFILLTGGVPFALRAQFHLLKPVPCLVWLALAVYLIRVAYDCRPYRWHLLLTAAAAVYMAFGSIDAPDDGIGWMAARAWAVTSAAVICGVLDHRLFMSTMRRAGGLRTERS